MCPSRAEIAMDPREKYRVILYDIDNAYVYRNVDELIRDDIMDVLDHAEREGLIPTEDTYVYQIRIMPNNHNPWGPWYVTTLTQEVFDRVKAMLDHSRNRGRHDHSYDRQMDNLAACVSALRLRASRLEARAPNRGSARGTPASSAFGLVRSRESASGAGRPGIDQVRQLEYLMTTLCREYSFVREISSAVETVERIIPFPNVWAWVWEMDAGRNYEITRKVLSFTRCQSLLRVAYFGDYLHRRDHHDVARLLTYLIKCLLYCVAVYEVYGSNRDIVMAALMEYWTDAGRYLVTGFCTRSESWRNPISSQLDLCCLYKSETNAFRKAQLALDFRSQFREYMGIPRDTTEVAWAAGRLRAAAGENGVDAANAV